MWAPQVTRHTSIRYQVLATNASIWVHRYSVNGWPIDFCLHRHPVSVNCLYHARMFLSVGGSFAYFARNARCTVTTDLLVWYSNTQNNFSPRVAIFFHYIHSQRLAAETWTTMKNNLLEETKLSFSFYLYGFCKYVSYGFPIINFNILPKKINFAVQVHRYCNVYF